MPYLGFDVCSPPTPALLVADMNGSGAQLVGLYVYNSSASFCTVSGAYIAEVERLFGRPCVLPIVTIATGDAPSGATIQNALTSRGMQGRNVGHDVETYAFPSVGELEAVIEAEHAIGCRCGMYGFDRTRVDYSADHWDWFWGVIGYRESFGYIRQGEVMFQYRGTTQMGYGAYDLNTVADGFSVLAGAAPVAPSIISSTDS